MIATLPPRTAPVITSVALAGNPNSGKTTIFNALTGLRQKVANYPGITVEKKTGRCHLDQEHWIHVLDLPGTYSLEPASPDESVASTVLRGQRSDTPPPDMIVAVIDASNLPRNLYLVSQLLELGKPLVIAFNMMDIAKRRGLGVDPAALQTALGVPVIPMIGHRRAGLRELKQAIASVPPAPTTPVWPLPEALWQELYHLERLIVAADPSHAVDAPSDTARHSLPAVISARRLLAQETDPIITALGKDPTLSAACAASRQRLAALDIEPMQADIEARYRWIEGILQTSLVNRKATRQFTEKLDVVLLHPFLGLGIFTLIMASLFVTVFWIADPINGAFEQAITWIGDFCFSGMSDGLLKSLVLDGVFAGVAAVIVFVPQIALLFLFLAFLEDSGYLARAAFLMDRALSKVGLHGKSFIPLLSSFACAIPGIMATRTIDSRRERLATILVAPFMSCSARLPVYALLIGAFFAPFGPMAQGGVLLGCYLLGILAAAGIGWLFKLSDRNRKVAGTFILELPTYKTPQASLVAWQIWNGVKAFLTKAGTIIFALSILIWAASTFPSAPDSIRSVAADQAEIAVRSHAETEPPVTETQEVDSPSLESLIASARSDAEAQVDLESSVAGRLGHFIEPAIAPLGFDWKIGVGLVGAFAAREVFNSTLSIIYNLGARDAEDITPLQQAILTDRNADGKPVWRPLTALSLLIWFVLAMQCISTTAVVKRETGGWTWPLLQLVIMNVVAYVACLSVFQIGSRLGF